MKNSGADDTLVDDGDLRSKIREPFNKVLELIGTKTLFDSLRCVNAGGIVCMTGIAGNSWTLENMNPMEFIPTGVCLSSYSGGNTELMETPLDELASLMEAGKLKLQIGKVFKIDDIVEAHRIMDANTAGGKIVVLT